MEIAYNISDCNHYQSNKNTFFYHSRHRACVRACQVVLYIPVFPGSADWFFHWQCRMVLVFLQIGSFIGTAEWFQCFFSGRQPRGPEFAGVPRSYLRGSCTSLFLASSWDHHFFNFDANLAPTCPPTWAQNPFNNK